MLRTRLFIGCAFCCSQTEPVSARIVQELIVVAAHLLAEAQALGTPRVRLSGPNYRGVHRSAASYPQVVPGALVVEPGSRVPSSVIRQIDAGTALVRHVGTCDDHPVSLTDLQPFADGLRVRVGADFGSSH